jgi:hypothetical protein
MSSQSAHDTDDTIFYYGLRSYRTPETEEDRIVREFLETGRDPKRKARTILVRLWRENKPMGGRIRHALADLFDPAAKPQRLVIKKRKPGTGKRDRPLRVALAIWSEMCNPDNVDARGRLLNRKRIIGMIGDRYGISRASVEAFWKKHRKEAEAISEESALEDLWLAAHEEDAAREKFLAGRASD